MSDVATVMEDTYFATDRAYVALGTKYDGRRKQNRFMRSREPFPEPVFDMAQVLYDRFYVRPRPPAGPQAIADPYLRHDFGQTLAAANLGSGSVSDGWRITERRGDRVVVEGPDWDRFTVDEADVHTNEDGTVRVKLAKNHSTRQQEFFHMFGDLDRPPKAGGQETRFYFHVAATGAVQLVREVTRHLNAARVPFRFKVISNPQGYARADAGVLYLDRDRYPDARPALVDVWRNVRPWLRPSVPAWTRALGAGLGVGESPGKDESFGMNRSRLLAEAAWLAHGQGVKDAEGRLEVARTHLAANDVDPDATHLQGGHDDIY